MNVHMCQSSPSSVFLMALLSVCVVWQQCSANKVQGLPLLLLYNTGLSNKIQLYPHTHRRYKTK